MSGKKEGFALTCGAWVCNQSIQAGFRLDCTLDPRQAMGRILVCISAVQTPARWFQGRSLRVSTSAPLPSALLLKLVPNGREMTAKHRQHPRSRRSAPAVARAGGDVIEIRVKRVLMKENQAHVLHPP